MNEMPVTPNEEPKKSNTGLIIGIVVVVLLCCCCAVGAGGWLFGDRSCNRWVSNSSKSKNPPINSEDFLF